MRAGKHLESCTEKCRYNTDGRCSFGIRHLGCYLDEDVRLAAGRLFGVAKEMNSIQAAKDMIRMSR